MLEDQPGELSSEAVAVLADGLVTADEYRDQFDVFRACAESMGLAIVDVEIDPVTGFVAYGQAFGPDFAAVGGDGCYYAHWHRVSRVYETESPAAGFRDERQEFDLHLRRFVLPCFEDHGYSTVPFGLDDPDFEARMADWHDLVQSGLCDPGS
ncbi:MAG: hypothetical protein GY926_25690 [bacterium]|nr:hypothetical protein [bacterium]